jgi:hypothetical protein
LSSFKNIFGIVPPIHFIVRRYFDGNNYFSIHPRPICPILDVDIEYYLYERVFVHIMDVGINSHFSLFDIGGVFINGISAIQ